MEFLNLFYLLVGIEFEEVGVLFYLFGIKIFYVFVGVDDEAVVGGGEEGVGMIV